VFFVIFINSFLTTIWLFLNNHSVLIYSVLPELKFNIQRLANIWPIHNKTGNMSFGKTKKCVKSGNR